MNDKTILQRMQLSDVLSEFPKAGTALAPSSGWLRAIRQALGMTQAQLGKRVGVARQSIQDLEEAEANRRITLDSLDRVARAMGCRLVYAVVPEAGTLDEVRERRAQVLAGTLLKPTEHSMKLEAQGVSDAESERQRKLLTQALLSGSPRKLWQ